MRSVILGAGGVGCVVAAQLARAGHDVVLIARGEQLRAIADRGLELRGLARFTVPVQAAPAAAGACDLLVVATKTPDTAAALEAVRNLRPATVASLQNGVVKDAVVAAAGDVLGAATMIGGTRLAPGVVEYTLDGVTVFGELGGGRSPRAEAIAAAWRRAGLSARAVDDVLAHEWAKQILQAAVSPLSVLTGLPTHLIYGTPALAEALVRMLREAAAVARALGVEPSADPGYGFDVRAIVTEPFDAAVARVLRRGEELAAAGKTDIVVSMLQDVRAGRPTELEETAGHVVREGARLGVATPSLALACDVVRGREAGYDQTLVRFR